MTRDRLFILAAPFEDGPGRMWFCAHCALIEGALQANPRWEEHVEVRRIGFPRPRAEAVAFLGEENQWLPLLTLADGRSDVAEAHVAGGHQILTDPIAITGYLARVHGGAAPHP